MVYDVAIIGAGPAGVVAAQILASKKLSVLLIEKGKDISKRKELTSGWFGHAIYVNKLDLNDPALNNKKALREAQKIINKISLEKPKTFGSFYLLSNTFGKQLAEYYYNALIGKADVIFNSEVDSVKYNKVFHINTEKQKFFSKKCIIATGKNSYNWISSLCNHFNISPIIPKMKIGLRIEVPEKKVKEMLCDMGQIKITNNNITTEDTCSFVGQWEDSGLISTIGHIIPNQNSRKINFLVAIEDDINNIIQDTKISNILNNDKPRVDKCSTYLQSSVPMDHLQTLKHLKQPIENIDKLLNIADYSTIYSPEVKLKGILPVNNRMKTKIANLFGVGECTIKAQTLLGAMASGLVAAKTILKEAK